MNQLTLRLAVLALLMTVGFSLKGFQSHTCHSGCSGDRCLNGGGNYGAILKIGESLTSSNGKAKAIMQSNGNLVIYCTRTGKPIWSSNTAGHEISYGATFQRDGNLVLYDTAKKVRFAANVYDKGGAMLIMQNDANLVIYTFYWKAVWSTNTWGKCN